MTTAKGFVAWEKWGRSALLAGVLGFSALVWPGSARADHSLGFSCLSCHSLRSTNVISGSRNVIRDNVEGTELYGIPPPGFWYCSTGGTQSTWSGSWEGGQPLDCSYCHNAAGTVPEEFALSTGSYHPVATSLDPTNRFQGVSNRILCNDCHGGDDDTPNGPNPVLLPKDPCDKSVTGSDTDGYPNHLVIVDGSTPHLSRPYGPLNDSAASFGGKSTPGVDWATWATNNSTFYGTDLLCFECHVEDDPNDDNPNTAVWDGYNRWNGGHNMPDVGDQTFTGKLPCYDCHDPHAGESAGLIIDRAGDIAYGTSDFSANTYNGTNDRDVCHGCHDGSHTVEGINLPNVLSGWTPTVFPFHADAHNDVASGGNCLQANNGCHASPHNTDIYRCFDCHSKAVTDAMTASGATPPDLLLAANHVDSEFGHIGSIGHNDIQSVHTIPYSDDEKADMSLPANNGCLYCHDAVGEAADVIVVGAGGAPALTGSRGNTFSTRESLEHFDEFCLSCHDGNGPTFTTLSNYTLSDDNEPSGNPINYPSDTFYPPQVNNQTGVGSGYFYDAGHGRGLSGAPSTVYPSGTDNPPAEIPCLECHLYHGSTAYKLLPGWRETADGVGHVIKGWGYPLKSSGKEYTGTAHSIGGILDSSAIDYQDYTNPSYGRAVSDYRNNDYWSSYGHSLTPTGEDTFFGTSGDVFDDSKLACGEDAEDVTGNDPDGSKEIGFCNTCHFYDEGTSAPNDGTTTTYAFAYTHRGDPAAEDCDTPPNSLRSKRLFWRDCAECHDPHGSGEDSSSGTANIFMMRQRFKYDATSWTNVLFTSRGLPEATAPESFDESDASNLDDLCNVCHTNLDHNNRASGGTAHYYGQRCTQCHPHGE